MPTSPGKPGRRSEDELDRQYAIVLQQVWSEYSNDVNRSIRTTQEQTLADILKTVLSPSDSGDKVDEPFEAHQTYQRVSNFFRRQRTLQNILGPEHQFVKRYVEDPRVRAIVRDIGKVERQIAEVTRPQVRLKELIQEMFTGNKEIRFDDKKISVEIKGKGEIDLPRLSSGEKHLLLICIEALTAGVNTFLIDEPELSLHVDWQHKLINSLLLLNPQMQLIAATHSPEIMADLQDQQVFRV